jgi:hypothetical protein
MLKFIAFLTQQERKVRFVIFCHSQRSFSHIFLSTVEEETKKIDEHRFQHNLRSRKLFRKRENDKIRVSE